MNQFPAVQSHTLCMKEVLQVISSSCHDDDYVMMCNPLENSYALTFSQIGCRADRALNPRVNEKKKIVKLRSTHP